MTTHRTELYRGPTDTDRDTDPHGIPWVGGSILGCGRGGFEPRFNSTTPLPLWDMSPCQVGEASEPSLLPLPVRMCTRYGLFIDTGGVYK